MNGHSFGSIITVLGTPHALEIAEQPQQSIILAEFVVRCSAGIKQWLQYC